MTVPAGETVTFSHIYFTDAQGNVQRWVNTVTGGGGTWTYTPATCGTNCQKVTVTRPSGDDTAYTFTLNSGGAWNTAITNYTGSASSNAVARSVTRDYDFSLTDPINGNVGFTRPIRATTTWPGPSGNLVTKTEDLYDTFTFNYQGANYTGSRGNVKTHSGYAYGSGSPGSLLRQQVFTYLYELNSGYLIRPAPAKCPYRGRPVQQTKRPVRMAYAAKEAKTNSQRPIPMGYSLPAFGALAPKSKAQIIPS